MNSLDSLVTEASTVDLNLPSTSTVSNTNPTVCRFYLRGLCRYGSMCRFAHDLPEGQAFSNISNEVHEKQKPNTSINKKDWANAPEFVPHGMQTFTMPDIEFADVAQSTSNRSWAAVVSGDTARPMDSVESSAEEVCPYEQPCPYGVYCPYGIHMELCEMCDQFCLHPTDQAQRRQHNQECIKHHEQAMELSFAIARSKDKTCGICFDTILEKTGREKRFGILPNCSHIFCLECIRKWRQAKQFEHKITRSCPECRVASDFVCPSAFWVETKEEKDKLLNDYRNALGIKDCKYFKKGEGKCPFGNKCFYKHALPNGVLVDVGCPKRARKLHRSPTEIIDLLDDV
ncbi:probable E3 ubiquitin-protein ligase makorin-1 isoform X2 [Teleopsis dalmanni]|uniref:probable E3 ubiquitin-protein ligase makorin-1 isoform X2 n=1 Tax=Teleopsis dalmanni TaxID=139649 RepID=UPI0018CF603E|nr:probable E3 ubiquitin-protein ligase makorin-1 isoform X2 [Teleopsis dalmanni]